MQRAFDHRPFLAPLAPLALIAAALAFTSALTPSLIPRTGALQGALAGSAFLAVYAICTAIAGVWHWLGLPVSRPGWLVWGASGVALVIIGFGLARATEWQNAVNSAAGIEPVETARPVIIAAVALGIIVPVIALGRLARLIVISAANRLARFLPTRVALLGALVLTASLFWSVGNGLLGAALLNTLDSAARQVDTFMVPEQSPPSAPVMSGSAASLVDWDSMGAAGRARVSAFPDLAQIEALAGSDAARPAMTPARVYVGLNSADTPEERAALALNELIRSDAFSREVLVIGTPTGTGWIHRASLSTLEYLWRGNVASVSVQYSYLPSWLTLLVDPDYGEESAQAVFRAVHDHWRGLPADSRPRLYLYGLSLGSLYSESSADLWDLLDAPYDGAFWVGPTFTNPLWQEFTARRNPDSPAWRPVLGSGGLVRFATQDGVPDHGDASWGPLRIHYLQYPSDAITFFEPESFYRRPQWLSPRAPEVTPEFRWVPVVTFFQLLADLFAAFHTPIGMGHVYSAAGYLDGWYRLTDPPGWDEDSLSALRAWYAEQGL